jgi:alpha-mannosidase
MKKNQDKTVHLISNAHLDPVWLWEWEEGAAEAISTFRIAAEFCEQFEGYIFNHNEVILYQWIEEYEPKLFQTIQRLVKQGKWHIMGGWYLQPDCNMPSGESFVRQILIGRNYFKEKFGVVPTTAINFDPFGHTRGLVQIIRKSGYDSYIVCRPAEKDCPLPANDFVWVGYDGSEIIGHRSFKMYNSLYGYASKKTLEFMETHPDRSVGLVLWGIGNHGGGPSLRDLQDLQKLMESRQDAKIIHSTPENYFKQLRESGIQLPRHEDDLNSFAVGCYTSQIRIKQKHRMLENQLFMVEKMMSHASLLDRLAYPKKGIQEALCNLLTSEFHDILPGSSIQPVEEASLRLLDHGLEICSKLRARAFFALAGGQSKAKEGEIPIFIYNPHPYKVSGIFECEFQLADQNWKEEFSLPIVFQNGKQVPSQPEKELSNLNLDWRKRIVFAADLEPSSMNRFDCQIRVIPEKPQPQLKSENNKITFKTDELQVVINTETGLMDDYTVHGQKYLKANAFLPLVIEDSDDSWGMRVNSFREVAGQFQLMSGEQGTKFSGVAGRELDSVRIIEDGPVRTVVEALFSYGNSFICQIYKLPKQGTEIEVDVRVYWNEKSKMLKLSVPTWFENGVYMGQVAYGRDELRGNGKEVVAQKWTALVSKQQDKAITCINDGIYGSDYCDGEFRLSLLRSPGYSGHPIKQRPIMPQDRFSSRMDQGERCFRFWLNGGSSIERLEKIESEALLHNEKPFGLAFFPSGEGEKTGQMAVLDDYSVQLTTFKKAENSEAYIIRLFESTGCDRSTVLSIPILGLHQRVELGKFEIKTFVLDMNHKTLTETALME